MSNKSIHSLNSKYMRQLDTIPCRLEFITELLKGKNLEPLVDFSNTDTEFFIPNIKDENESGQSYDTTVVLRKRQLNFGDTIAQIGGRIHYIKSGTTGHTFKGEATDEYGTLEYGVKVVAYPKKERYGNIYDTRRPENAELMMIKLLSYFIAKKQTPHIVLPIGTFNTDITTFVNLIATNVVAEDNEKYIEFVERYKKGDYHDTVSILISEWANRGDLLDFIRKYHNSFTPSHWKSIFFQVISVLAVIQSKYPTFRHNDLKANNVLVQKISSQREYFSYTVDKCKYQVKNIGYQIKMWDFDFACIPGIVDNKKVESEWTKEINVTPVRNKYYDVHYFFNTLIKRGFCPEVMTSEKVPQEVKNFINRIIPKKYQKTETKYVGKKGRILINDEYVTPADILKYDPYFEEYRTKKSNQPNQPNQPNQMNQSSQSNIVDQTTKSTKSTKSTKTKKSTLANKQINKTNIPDLTKFLKDSDSDSDSDSNIDLIKNNELVGGSKTKSKNKKKTNSNDKLNLLIDQSIKAKVSKSTKSTKLAKPVEKVKTVKTVKIDKPTKTMKSTKDKKKRSRTISEEIRDLNIDVLLNSDSS